MDWGRVTFIFFVLMSLTSTIGFLFDKNVVMLFIAAGINILSTILKLGVRTQLSAEMMASSLVADLHLIPAFIAWQVFNDTQMATALSIGALVANIVSMILILIESIKNNDNF